MTFDLRSFTLIDYDEVRALWESADEVGLSSADSRDGIANFLTRNPDLSIVATSAGRIAGALLVSHDGRRGYLHHLVVAATMRGQGLGRRLVREGLRRLAHAGIEKAHIFVFQENVRGQAFWSALGAQQRSELKLFSLATGQ